MKINGIHHVILAVKDMDRAAAKFSSLFDTTFEDMGEFPDFGVKSRMCPEGIELLAPTGPDSQLAKYLAGKGEGLYAVSVSVKDADKAAADARDKGLRAVGKLEAENVGKDNLRLKEIFLHPQDAHGVLIALTQLEKPKAKRSGTVSSRKEKD